MAETSETSDTEYIAYGKKYEIGTIYFTYEDGKFWEYRDIGTMGGAKTYRKVTPIAFYKTLYNHYNYVRYQIEREPGVIVHSCRPYSSLFHSLKEAIMDCRDRHIREAEEALKILIQGKFETDK